MCIYRTVSHGYLPTLKKQTNKEIQDYGDYGLWAMGYWTVEHTSVKMKNTYKIAHNTYKLFLKTFPNLMAIWKRERYLGLAIKTWKQSRVIAIPNKDR